MLPPLFSFLPSGFVNLIAPLSLIYVGYLVEKNYVGRTALFANAVAINLDIYYTSNPNVLYLLYSWVGAFFGIIAILSYQERTPLPWQFYVIGMQLYSSVTTAVMTLLF